MNKRTSAIASLVIVSFCALWMICGLAGLLASCKPALMVFVALLCFGFTALGYNIRRICNHILHDTNAEQARNRVRANTWGP